MWIVSKWLNNRNMSKMIKAGAKLQELEDKGARPGDKQYDMTAIEYIDRSLRVRKYHTKRVK